jgi:hypothetical protein
MSFIDTVTDQERRKSDLAKQATGSIEHLERHLTELKDRIAKWDNGESAIAPEIMTSSFMDAITKTTRFHEAAELAAQARMRMERG